VRLLRAGEARFDRTLLELEQRIARDGLRLERKVRPILDEVRKKGDRALLHYTRLFDGVGLRSDEFEVTQAELEKAYRETPPELIGTLKKAAHRIRRFHQLQVEKPVRASEKGIRLGQMMRPLKRVGIYVPGGKASYPSTVLMAAIPAKVAGVEEIVMVTPPRKEGISPAVLVAADLAGVDRTFRVGGVQAIAALAYGTATIPPVDKIVGPGNQYVAAAKSMVFGTVDIDMVAGPSEIVIISDEKTPASFLAADLISQAEHDEMALAVLITPSEQLGRKVAEELKSQLSSLGRKRIAQASLRRRGAIFIVRDLDEALELANRIAPEHLELAVSTPSSLLKGVKNAGAVFLGPYTPEAIGDYLAGPNHILPTGGTARFSSSLGVGDFVKRINVMGFTRSALKSFEEDVRRLTDWEGLEGHYRAVQIRVRTPRRKRAITR
jgi:histidinol dehydrogenase